MGRKIKNVIKPKAPPRSIGDIIIIILVFIFLLAATLGIICLFLIILPDSTNPKSDNILNCISRGGAFNLPFALTICIYLIAPVFIFNTDFRFFHRRRPFKHDGLVKKVYPLFSKDWKLRPRSEKTPERIKKKRKTVIIMASVLLVTAMLVPFSLFGKTIWYNNDTIKVYNYVGKMTEQYDIKEADKIQINAYDQYHYSSGYRGINLFPTSVSYEINISVYFGDERFTVSMKEDESGYYNSLKNLIRIKNMYTSDKITKNDDELTKVLYHTDFSSEEIDLIRELFDQ